MAQARVSNENQPISLEAYAHLTFRWRGCILLDGLGKRVLERAMASNTKVNGVSGAGTLPAFRGRRRAGRATRALTVEERKAMARDWLDTPEADEELNKKKYRGMYVYVIDRGIAGYGRTMHEAGRMAERRTGTNPADMIELLLPWYDVDF